MFGLRLGFSNKGLDVSDFTIRHPYSDWKLSLLVIGYRITSPLDLYALWFELVWVTLSALTNLTCRQECELVNRFSRGVVNKFEKNDSADTCNKVNKSRDIGTVLVSEQSNLFPQMTCVNGR